jgi:tetratricopeptide (TPR) repeat protein
MYSNAHREDKEIEAIQLIDQAETYADKGKGDEAIKYYEQAAQIYIDIGSYLKLDELFIRIAQIISRFKNNIQAVYRLESIIRKTEELSLYEISAKLLIRLGNLYNEMKDWESAGENWEKAANYLSKADPDEYRNPASMLLLKAGQVFERSRIKKDLGKRLILKAVMKINKFDELYEKEEKEALKLLSSQNYEASANKFLDIADYFKKSLENLEELLDEAESKDTMLNAKARFIHFIAEYETVAALCLIASKNEKYVDKIRNLGQDSIKLFKESINLLKNHLLPKNADFDHEVVMRITFDTMLLEIIQRNIGEEKVESVEFLLRNLENNKALVKKLKETPYFKIIKKIEKVGILDSLNDLLKVNLGHFEKIKNTLISYFQGNL